MKRDIRGLEGTGRFWIGNFADRVEKVAEHNIRELYIITKKMLSQTSNVSPRG